MIWMCFMNVLHEWSVRWQLKFNISKCKHIHFGSVHQFGSYYLNGIKTDSVELQKDLGILFDHQLKFTYSLLMLLQKLIVYWGWSENLLTISIQICWSNYLLLLTVLLWNTAIRYGGHYLFLIKGKLKRFNVELQDYYHQLETDLMGRDSRYYSCHLVRLH